MAETWVVRDARERAEAVAEFLAGYASHDTIALPVGVIAQLPGCPIRPGFEAQALADAAESEALGYVDDRDYHLRRAAGDVGSEGHCRRVTQALTVAFKRGLVGRTRRGKGPWEYWTLDRR